MKKTFLFFILIIINSYIYSQSAEEYDKLAHNKMELKDYQYAMVLITKAIELDNKNQWYYLRQAEIEFNLTGPSEAIKIIRSAILLNKKESEPYNRAGTYYSSAGITDSAIAMYNYAIKFAKNDTLKNAYISNRGAAKYSNRDFEGAVIDFENVLIFNPEDIGALLNASSGYSELGMVNKAIDALKKIIAIDPGFIGSYGNLGFIYSELDSLDLALKYFNKVSELDPNDAVNYNNRGNNYYKKGDYINALKDINLSIKMYPSNSYAYRNLALVYIAMNKINEACTALSFANDYGFEKQYGTEVSELIKKHCKK
ncbi:MAG: tetratricopeptide repeat protein [Bacteroidales bacterium]